jgi:DNA-directed RNA polymerase sigma subunit (sigma70/sigma32)
VERANLVAVPARDGDLARVRAAVARRAATRKRLEADEWEVRAAILAAHHVGRSLREIGREAGISHERVRQILQGP